MAFGYLIKLYASHRVKRLRKMRKNPIRDQEYTLIKNLKSARYTEIGKDLRFDDIRSYQDFKAKVPIQNYETLKPYIDKILTGGKTDILWKAKPLYMAKTSGTISGSKYIPITKESINHHIKAAQDTVFNYADITGRYDLISQYKNIFLQGSPLLKKKNGIYFGRLSGISAHHIPKIFQKNNLPSWKTNCMEDWEKKVQTIVEETFSLDIGMMGGIPSWLQMYFNYLIKKTGKKVGEIFPNLSLLVVGGTNYIPYRSIFKRLIGKPVDVLQVYTASEAFIAVQDTLDINNGLQLLTDTGTFYEFVPVSEIYQQNPTRLSLAQVELGKEYAVLLTTNSGLWAYNIGDTVCFISLKPYRIVVSGRISHFLSAFGEHVIVREVEDAMTYAMEQHGALVREFSVAPRLQPLPEEEGEKPYHEWFIEFEKAPEDIQAFSKDLDAFVKKRNSYYKDLREGNVIQKPKVRCLVSGSFHHYMDSVGKLGEQFKIPRLSNDRKIADSLEKYLDRSTFTNNKT